MKLATVFVFIFAFRLIDGKIDACGNETGLFF